MRNVPSSALPASDRKDRRRAMISEYQSESNVFHTSGQSLDGPGPAFTVYRSDGQCS
jgi:hypothetical protein